ncbi:hypothetical protein BANRA_05505 [Escherichia coli]|uniref:Uncharacterized protein n=1 Tax=Escherichia coli TaxID=562 RepID=A0A3P5HF68_ECOLX|nr:hypothetical protein BANRA_05505 [Escherichia coli]
MVADTPVTISRDNALKSQITKLLASIQNKGSDTPLDDKEKGFISSTTIPVFKYLVDPQMLGVSNSMIYQLTDYIGYDILLQYIQELIQQARAMVATGNYDEAVIEHINDNMNDATRQIAAFQSQVQVQQDALLVVDRQMSYMRQQLSPACSVVTRTTITSEEHAVNEVYVIAGGEWLRNNLNAITLMGTGRDSIEKLRSHCLFSVAVMWVQRHNVMDLLGCGRVCAYQPAG